LEDDPFLVGFGHFSGSIKNFRGVSFDATIHIIYVSLKKVLQKNTTSPPKKNCQKQATVAKWHHSTVAMEST